VVRLVCNQCGRRGQYRKATLLTQYPADTAMPDLLREIANCDRFDSMRGGCGAHYDLAETDLARRNARPVTTALAAPTLRTVDGSSHSSTGEARAAQLSRSVNPRLLNLLAHPIGAADVPDDRQRARPLKGGFSFATAFLQRCQIAVRFGCAAWLPGLTTPEPHDIGTFPPLGLT
jgi:hypothetical protein